MNSELKNAVHQMEAARDAPGRTDSAKKGGKNGCGRPCVHVLFLGVVAHHCTIEFECCHSQRFVV